MMKVDKQGLINEKKTPKYYQYRIKWVFITDEIADKYLKNKLSWTECTLIAKSINYSTESIHKVFRNKPKKVNKVVWDAILAYLNVKDLL